MRRRKTSNHRQKTRRRIAAHSIRSRHRIRGSLQLRGRNQRHHRATKTTTHNTGTQRAPIQAHLHRIINLRARNTQLITHRHERLRENTARLLKRRETKLISMLQQIARTTHQSHIVERMTHPTARERTRTTRILQGVQGTIHRRIHQISTPRLRRARIHTRTGQILRQRITQKTQTQSLSARLRRRTTSRKTAIRQLMRSVRINHQKTQAMLGNIHRNRLNRKITEINHQSLLRM